MWRKLGIVVVGMRIVRQHHCVFFSSLPSPCNPKVVSASTQPLSTNSFTLTPQDLARIDLLIPRLQPPLHRRRSRRLRPIATSLVSSYLRLRHALEVYNWMASPCPPDADLCRALVHGLCRSGMLLEGLRVFRAMVAADFDIGIDLRKRVYSGLLREAMVGEARELDEAFAGVSDDVGGDGFKIVLELLDRIIANWVQ